MPEATLLLSAAYLLPIALIALLMVGKAPSARRKILLLAALPAFYIAHFLGLQAIQGWPARTPPPDDFQLLAHSIREPGPRAGDDGEILLWLRRGPDQPPRVHRLAYDRQLHQALTEAGERQAAGRPQRGYRRHQEATSGDGPSPESAARLRFEDDTPRGLPAKRG